MVGDGARGIGEVTDTVGHLFQHLLKEFYTLI